MLSIMVWQHSKIVHLYGKIFVNLQTVSKEVQC